MQQIENSCPQCKKQSLLPANRLVQDACGHKKCRSCLLEDEEKCKQCLNLKNGQIPENDFVFENHTAVIQCSGKPKFKLQKTLDKNNAISKLNETDTVSKALTAKDENKPVFAETGNKKVPSKRSSVYEVPAHVTQTSDNLSFHCKICNKSFRTKSHVKYHKYCTGELKPYKCNICNKEFVLKVQLDLHQLKHRNIKPLNCNVCQKSFYEKSKLSRHMTLHSNERKHLCTECGKGFKSKESLKIHNAIHKGDKLFPCKICPAKFNNSSNLKRHLVTHSKDKVHMCDQCGKRFKLKWALLVHRRSHLKVRPFKCSVCSKAFVNNKDLQRHNLIHADAKSYLCSICSTSFRRKDNLYRHMKNTHPGKKGEIIKQETSPEISASERPSAVIVDQPNAINVIRAPPAAASRSKGEPSGGEPSLNIVDSRRAGSVINGPIKLAFKTPAFKSHYNITRDCNYIPGPQISKPITADPVDVRQQILPPNFYSSTIDSQISPASSNDKTAPNRANLIQYTSSLHYATSFQNHKHAMIKNIKFKVPKQYTMLAKQNEGETESAMTPGVIVSGATSDVHWRRRTSQNLVSKF